MSDPEYAFKLLLDSLPSGATAIRDEFERLRRFEQAWYDLAGQAPGLGRTLAVMTALEKKYDL